MISLKGLTLALRNSSWYFPFLVWTHRYDKRIRKPGWFSLLVSLSFRPLRVSSVFRRYRATRLPADTSCVGDFQLTPIELLIVTHPKDFGCLPLCITSAERASRNKVVKITVVVPDASVSTCEKLLSSKGINAQVTPESLLFPTGVVGALERSFGKERYGWILQQMATIAYCLQSESAGVLAVNADTILTYPRVWLDNRGRQPLLVSSEFTPEYYSFLESIGLCSNPPQHTFVAHHMLFQPELLRELAAKSTAQEFLVELSQKVVDTRDKGQVAFCLEFEPYAQHLFRNHPERFELVKFANRPIYGNLESSEMQRQVKLRLEEYSSLSFHAYLRS